MPDIIAHLKNGVVLAELGGYGDGPYCARHGRGAALVLLGTYIVDPGDAVPYPPSFVFKPDRARYESYLYEHIRIARSGGAKVGVSVISTDLSHTVEFLRTAAEAGADCVSLCAHSEMEMFTRHGLGDHLCLKENANLLKRWTTEIVQAVSVPVIIKIALVEPTDTAEAVHLMANLGVPIVHINIRDSAPGSFGLRFLGQLTGVCQCLIAGGGVEDVAGARRVLAAGADAVAIASAAMRDPALCGNIQKALRNAAPATDQVQSFGNGAV